MNYSHYSGGAFAMKTSFLLLLMLAMWLSMEPVESKKNNNNNNKKKGAKANGMMMRIGSGSSQKLSSSSSSKRDISPPSPVSKDKSIKSPTGRMGSNRNSSSAKATKASNAMARGSNHGNGISKAEHVKAAKSPKQSWPRQSSHKPSKAPTIVTFPTASPTEVCHGGEYTVCESCHVGNSMPVWPGTCQCPECRQAVCQTYPECCNDDAPRSWNDQCADLAKRLSDCQVCAIDPPCGDCGEPSYTVIAKVGCSCSKCETSVCSYDPYCCGQAIISPVLNPSGLWDATCVLHAKGDVNCAA